MNIIMFNLRISFYFRDCRFHLLLYSAQFFVTDCVIFLPIHSKEVIPA